MRVRVLATRNDEIVLTLDVPDDAPLDPSDDAWVQRLYESRTSDVMERTFSNISVERIP